MRWLEHGAWAQLGNGPSKVKQSRYTSWRRLGERKYSSYSFTTSALDRGEWSASHPGRALPPGKGPPVPDTEDRGKILCPCRGSNPDRPVVQPVVRHYTDWSNGPKQLEPCGITTIGLCVSYSRVVLTQRCTTGHANTGASLAPHSKSVWTKIKHFCTLFDCYIILKNPCNLSLRDWCFCFLDNCVLRFCTLTSSPEGLPGELGGRI
jgi:hypothetical protein